MVLGFGIKYKCHGIRWRIQHIAWSSGLGRLVYETLWRWCALRWLGFYPLKQLSKSGVPALTPDWSHGRPLVSSKSFLFWYPTNGSSDQSSTLLQKAGVVVTSRSEAYNDHNGTLVSLGSGQQSDHRYRARNFLCQIPLLLLWAPGKRGRSLPPALKLPQRIPRKCYAILCRQYSPGIICNSMAHSPRDANYFRTLWLFDRHPMIQNDW